MTVFSDVSKARSFAQTNAVATYASKARSFAQTNVVATYAACVLGFLLAAKIMSIYIERHEHHFVVHPQLAFDLSILAEGLGLMVLWHKVNTQRTVAGISGQTVGVFVVGYGFRFLQCPPMSDTYIMAWAFKIVESVSFLIILDVARCIFITYKSTYDSESDTIQMKYVVAACLVLNLLYVPKDGHGRPLAFYVIFFICVDMFALVPQVVMMAKDSSFVASPIAHYVVAIGLSRSLDLWSWCEEYQVLTNFWKVSFDGWYVIALHVVNLCVVSDFGYYWCRTMVTKCSFNEDVCLEP